MREGIFREAARLGIGNQGALQAPGAAVVPGSVQLPYYDPSPNGNPRQGGTRRYVLSDILVHNGLAGDYNTPILGESPICNFKVGMPSTRLHWLIAWTYEPNDTEDTSFPGTRGNWTVSADAWIKPQQNTARTMRANNLFTNRAIPTSYEATSGIDEVRGTITVPISDETGGTGIPPGRLYLTAMWEPAAGDNIPDDELRKLFAGCWISVLGISTTQNGSAP